MARRLVLVAAVAVALALGGFTALLAGEQTQAPARQTVSAAAQNARGSADADANVKTRIGPNDPANEKPAPAAKGGDKTRGAACTVNFDNYTPWRIETYVDGEYWGTVAPWGDMDTYAGNGPTRVYARALFRDGSMKYWGPSTFNCVQGGYYVWKLDR